MSREDAIIAAALAADSRLAAYGDTGAAVDRCFRYWDRTGAPIVRHDGIPACVRWGILFEDLDYQRVARTQIAHLIVSTVWLGIPSPPFSHRPPLIFESAVIEVDSVSDRTMRRYATEADALAGHDELVAAIRAEVDADFQTLPR